MKKKLMIMNQISTYSELFILGQDIKNEMARSPAFEAFNRQRIKRFFQMNSIRLNMMDSTVARLQNKYAQINDDGKMASEKINGQDTVIFKSEEGRASYLQEYADFMNQHITIEL